MLAKTGCKRKDEAKKKYLKHSEEKLHQPIAIVMIYDDCDEMVTMVNVVLVGGGANLKAMVKMTTRSSLIAWSSTSLVGGVGLVQTQSQEPG